MRAHFDAKHMLFDGADPAVAAGIRECVNQLTELHSVTSRRHSVATLLRRHVDQPFVQAVSNYKGDWNKELLDGFLPSRAWQRSPANSKPLNPESRTKLELANICAERWYARLRWAIRSAQAAAKVPTPRACAKFCTTLDSLMALIEQFSNLRPAHTQGPNGRVTLQAHGHGHLYCELCWRQTEYAAVGGQRDSEDRRLNISRRFCVEHNQQKSPSNYRRDLKFKGRFEVELATVKSLLNAGVGRQRSAFVFTPDLECPSGQQMHLVPVSSHAEDIRRAAYAMVHSGLQGTQGQCLALQAQGHSPAEIAELLGITARGVRLALAAVKPRLVIAERIRWGSRMAPI